MVRDPRKDFRIFLAIVWQHLRLPEPTKRQYELAYWLQHGPPRMVLEAFRGIGKSWITAAFVIWLLLNNPQLNIMVVSASKARAEAFSTFVLRLIHEMPILAHLRPSGDQRQSKLGFDVGPARASQAPSVFSVGIGGQMTGFRADVIIPDDVEVPKNSQTQDQRNKLARSVTEFEAILKPEGMRRVIYLGTPQCQDSLYTTLEEKGYTIRIWPARYPREEWMKNNGKWLAPNIATELVNEPSLAGGSHPLYGLPTDTRFDDTDLRERELAYGRSGYALQFMLDTTLSDAMKYPLKLSDLIVMGLDRDEAPEKVIWGTLPQCHMKDLPCVGLRGDKWYGPLKVAEQTLPYTGTVMAIDPSGRGADETAYAVVKMLNGQLFLMDAGGVVGGYDENTLRLLAGIAAENKVNQVIVESNFGDGMFTQLLKPVLSEIHPCGIEEVRSSKQKELRIIDTLEPVLNAHKLIVNEKLIEKDIAADESLAAKDAVACTLFYQLTRITRERGALAHDDRLDALAMAVAYWTDQMDVDTRQMAEDRRKQAMQKALEDHAAACDKAFVKPSLKWWERPTNA